MIFKFESKFQGFGSPTNTLEVEVDDIDDVLDYFAQFLRGSGYVINGDLVITENSNEYDSKFDFSNLPQNNWPFSTQKESVGKCPVCKLDNETMEFHKCYDVNCPKDVL